MLRVVSPLNLAPSVRFVNRPPHRIGDFVAVQNRPPLDIPRRPPNRLDQRPSRPQKTFLVGIQNCYKRNLRKIQAFAQKIDAYEDVVLALAEVAEEADAFEGFDLGVHVVASDAALNAVIGEVLGHALGEGGDEDALVTMGGIELYASKSAFSRASDRRV